MLAACAGPDALAHALDPGDEPPPETGPSAAAAAPATTFLRSLTVEGFRGIGKPATIELAPGAGLTLVVGRNGSGKSSFAEALELLLTGTNARWADRTSVWREGWRNLHHPTARIEVGLARDGVQGETTISATWADDAKTADERAVTVKGPGAGTFDELGWERALVTYRPFLSYSELGRMFEKPSALWESLNAVLGLGQLDEMLALLARARKDADAAAKGLRASAKGLLGELAGNDDARAAACATALAAKPLDLDALELVLDARDDAGGDLPLLRSLAALSSADAATTAAVLGELAAAIARRTELDLGDAGRAAQLVALLDQALTVHDESDHECAVCSGTLPDEWRERTRAGIERLRAASAEHTAANAALRDCAMRAAGLAALQPPAALAQAGASGLDPAPALAAWERWSAVAQRPYDLPAEAPAILADLRAAVGALAEAAEQRISEAEAAWRPIARRLAAWLPDAQVNLQKGARLSALKAAEEWLLGAADALREERLAPIRDAAIANWNLLRHESNVAFDGIELAGKGTQRRANFSVSVDDSGAAALGVMSQGELHALALSVFLPRATRAESPFRFVMIDDPVQSMDPAKVDGLARVLAAAAETRQVIVFTHDERLAEATRRLGLAARITTVQRQPGSLVRATVTRGPAQQAIAEARALLRDEHVRSKVRARVVPLLCRSAIEASAAVPVRASQLGRGVPHESVEAALLGAHTLYQKVALALFDDAERSGDVLTTVDNKFGAAEATALKRANRGAHGSDDGLGLEEFVSARSRLCTGLEGC